MPTTATRKISGEFETCCHRVSWWYDVERRLSVEAKRQLRREAFQRARSSIIKGFHCGDLCASVVTGDQEYSEFWGWWQIIKD